MDIPVISHLLTHEERRWKCSQGDQPTLFGAK